MIILPSRPCSVGVLIRLIVGAGTPSKIGWPIIISVAIQMADMQTTFWYAMKCKTYCSVGGYSELSIPFA